MMVFNSEITMILVLVDDKSKLSGERKHNKNDAFAKACRAKRPSHLSHEAIFFYACYLPKFERSSRRIFQSGAISD